MTAGVRRPVQAGTFYPREKNELEKQIRDCFLNPLGPRELPRPSQDGGDTSLVALVVPHAGYMYSGAVAAHSYKRLSDTVPHRSIVIIGPNHTGYGTGVSTMTEGEWATPLGNVPVNGEVAERIARSCRLIDVEELAHKLEHSVEVQLPFLQYIYDSAFDFVPICMMLQDLKTSSEVGKALAEAASEDESLMLIASSDWTHYEPYAQARKKDLRAIDAVLGLNEAEFHRCVEENMISSCGFGPVAATIYASKLLGATKAQLLSYQNSGDVTGDKSAVVGYASISFTR